MGRRLIAPFAALALALVLVTGCGTNIPGVGTVTVQGLAPGQTLLCGPQGGTVLVQGSGFLSEHGVDVTVLFAAVPGTGTPFQGGTSDMEEVPGTVLSDTLCEVQLPNVVGDVTATISVILPGLNLGTSPPQSFSVGGNLIGPFAFDDFIQTVTGNVPWNAAAPGVLENDQPSFCGREVEESPGASGSTSQLGLTVIVPPAGSLNPFDASPGIVTPTLQGGEVEIQADGSFVYEPPLGYEGQDEFTYWMQEPGRPEDDATVRLTIAKVVWFIRDTVAAGGSGRFSDPFDSLASFNAAQNAPPTNPFAFPPTAPIPANPDDAPQEGDCIFIYDNVNTMEYDEGIRLRDFQQLIGEGVGLMLNNTQIVLPGTAPNPNPVLTNTGIAIGEAPGVLPVVTLGNANVVRGIDIDEGTFGNGYGDGIYGTDVSGPTFIDQVNIANANQNGIHLEGGFLLDLMSSAQPIIGGTFQIGDPAPATFPCVTITDSGAHGILIGGGQFTSFAQGAVNGLTVNVIATEINGAQQNGIEANDVNLAVELTMIEDVETGINYTNFLFGTLCTLDVINSNIGIDPTTGPCRFRGVQINPFGGDIRASVGFTSGRAQDTFLYGGGFSQGIVLDIAFDSNDFETIVTSSQIPTVRLFGTSTTVTSMDSNFIVGNGTGEGMWFESINFDADTVLAGTQEVEGGNTDLGQGVATNQRVEGTALRFLGCTGSLGFTTIDIFQLGGDPTGVENTGTLTLDVGTKVIDHQP